MENYNSGNQNIGGSGNMIITGNSHAAHSEQAKVFGNEDSWKTIALELVAKGQLKQALATMIRAFNNDEDLKRQAILLLGRISQVEMDVIAGTISKQAESEEINKIRQGVVSLVAQV